MHDLSSMHLDKCIVVFAETIGKHTSLPARLRATVVMSALYMASGSWITEPSLKAGPVVEGPTSTVQSWRAASSSCLTLVRTCTRPCFVVLVP